MRPLREFLKTEAAGGVLIVAAATVALVWANSPWSASYEHLWNRELASLDLRHWVNDGLMTIFFLVVGLEIKRELVQGELRDARRAALPVIAAAGGMVAPALLYLALNSSGSATRGWGVPIATDIAIVVGITALLRSRVSPSLTLFLLALAIVDDIGAIAVIAVFYSSGISAAWLAGAAVSIGVLIALRVCGVTRLSAYVLAGFALWLSLHEGGVHATIAGVICGLLAPAGPTHPGEITPDEASVVEWLEHRVHPWSTYLVVPMFALANAGLVISREARNDIVDSSVSRGVIAGLVVGKPLGIVALSWLAVKLNIGKLPTGATWAKVAGVASLAGVGFTVSLLIADLAFSSNRARDEARVGVFIASLSAGAIGSVALLATSRIRETSPGRQRSDR